MWPFWIHSFVVSFHQVYNTLVFFPCFSQLLSLVYMLLGCNVLHNRAFSLDTVSLHAAKISLFSVGFVWTLRSLEIAAFAGILSLAPASAVTLGIWMTFVIWNTRISGVWIFDCHFVFSLKTAEPAAPLLAPFAYDFPQGAGTAPFTQEIYKLSTETL